MPTTAEGDEVSIEAHASPLILNTQICEKSHSGTSIEMFVDAHVRREFIGCCSPHSTSTHSTNNQVNMTPFRTGHVQHALLLWFPAALILLTTSGAITAQAQSTPGDNYGLHPVCDTIIHNNLMSMRTRLQRFDGYELEISCFSYMINLTSNAPASCDTSAAQILVDVFNNRTNETLTIDLGRALRGSIYGVAYRFDTPRRFTLYVSYPYVSLCPAVVYYSLYGGYTPRTAVPRIEPFVVDASPLVMYRRAPYTVTFQYPGTFANATAARMLVTVLNVTESCSRDAARTAARNPAAALVSWQTPRQFTWTTQVTHTGAFRICVKSPSDTEWSIAAMSEAYGANPAYFDSTMISTGRYEITFYGEKLNAVQDTVRLVSADSADACDDPGARPAPGVTTAPLRAGSQSGTTQTIVTFNRDGAFLVCYFHFAAHETVDVPNYDTLSRHVIDNVTNPNQQQINFNNTNGTSNWLYGCASAPVVTANARVTSGDVAKIVVGGDTVPGDFAADVAALLCLRSASSVSIARIQPSGASTAVFLRIDCPMDFCNSAERLAALVANARQLYYVESATAVPFNGIAVSSNNTAPAPESHALVYVVVALCVVLVGVIAVAVVVIMRRRKHHRAAAAFEESEPVEGEVVRVHRDGGRGEPQPRDTDMSPIPPPPEKPYREARSTSPTNDAFTEAEDRAL
jgi:hypothetical protein